MSKRLKIAMFIDTYFPMIDGVIMVVHNYAKRLQAFADVTVFCPTVDKSYVDDSGYRVVRCRSFKPFFLEYVAPMPQFDPAFHRYLKKERFDIVHIHSPFAVGAVGARYAKKRGIPLVATLHSQFKREMKTRLKIGWLTNLVLRYLMRTFNRCDECWAVNEGVRQLYVNEYGLKPASKATQNACDFLPLENKEAVRREVRERFGVADNEKLFLFVGRIASIKNIPFLVQSLACLKQKGMPFKTLFVGDGLEVGAIRKLLHTLQLDDEVRLIGEVRDRQELAKLYAAADLFLFPSLGDTNSLVQIEAAAQGLPTLFIRGALTASGCVEDHNAFMSEHRTEAYAEEIIRIFKNPALYQTVSANAQAELYHTWDDCVRAVQDEYQRIIRTYGT